VLALNGLRVSEATGANIENLGVERGHRTLVITRKGGKVAPSRSRRGRRGRSTWPSVRGWTGLSSLPPMDSGWTATAPPASSAW
jgi:hypothetical protein